jgi:hypothetical protein
LKKVDRYEVFEVMGLVGVEEWPTVQESTKTRSILHLTGVEEQLWQQQYTVWEAMEEMELRRKNSRKWSQGM